MLKHHLQTMCYIISVQESLYTIHCKQKLQRKQKAAEAAVISYWDYSITTVQLASAVSSRKANINIRADWWLDGVIIIDISCRFQLFFIRQQCNIYSQIIKTSQFFTQVWYKNRVSPNQLQEYRGRNEFNSRLRTCFIIHKLHIYDI